MVFFLVLMSIDYNHDGTTYPSTKASSYKILQKMPSEDSRKRKSLECESGNLETPSEEPKTKLIKINDEVSEPNLENASDQTISECNEKQTSEIKSSPCCISIKFHDDTASKMYKQKIINYLESFIEFQIKSEDDLSVNVYRDDSLNPDEWVVVKEAEIDTLTTSVETSPNSPRKRKKHSKVKKELFIVDATPSPHSAQVDMRYTSKFTISADKIGENADQKSSKQTCFNCDHFHALKDCPEPKNFARINAARQKFRLQPKSSRYHLEEDNKFSHFVPGKVSHELRKALGLHRNETPHYIYLMRKLGYPPGWLEEAKFVHSNLDLIDIDGNYVKTSPLKQKGLDPEKIIEFPGFNVPLEKGMKDEYRTYGVPPYSDDFSKQAMIEFYNKKFAQEEDNLETCDMDIDHEQDTSIQEKPEEKEKEKENRDSPSLIDLEQQKKHLLEELNEEPPKIENKTLNIELEKDTLNIESEKEVLTVKTSHFGTPILKSNSPYSTLPNPDNFSKNVSPVINFENLPNSTGRYEQMAYVLQKVRTTLKKLQNCNM